MKSPFLYCAISLTLSLGALSAVYAGSATWNLNPTSGDWNTAANWTPATVPNGPRDVATFGASNITAVTATSVEVNSIVFDSGASPFTINPKGGIITISGVGVINNSGIMQDFVINLPSFAGFVYFKGHATSGDLVQYTLSGTDPNSSGISFFDHATAATSTFVIYGSDSTCIQTGPLTFWDTSSAENATIILNGGICGGIGGTCEFINNSTASSAFIFVNGATLDEAIGGTLFFEDVSTAGDATLIAQSGQNGGGQIVFNPGGYPSGGTAKIKLFGNGRLDDLIDKLIEIGSLEGDGLVSLGGVTGAYLSVGTNNLNTTFSGLIEERFAGARSTLAKTGTGSLTLTGANTYTGGTQIEKGKLVVNNSDGSGTGTDSVGVFGGGQLTGIGRIAGAVIISGPGAFLSPGNHGANPGTLATHSTLSFNANGIYRCALNSKNAAVDEVVANGVAIDGARFGLVDPFGLQLPAGTVLTVIDNTSALPITGTFSNLPDGGTIRVGINIFKANYEGGDGNDLTLTVVQ